MSDPNEIPLGPEPTPPPPSTFPPSSTVSPTAATPVGGTAAYAGPAATPDAKTMSMLAHILNFTLLGPLLIYLLKKDAHPFINDQAKEALNFSLSCLIPHVILGFIHIMCIGPLLSMGLFVVQIILGVMGGLKARDGLAYRYPLNFRFIN